MNNAHYDVPLGRTQRPVPPSAPPQTETPPKVLTTQEKGRGYSTYPTGGAPELIVNKKSTSWTKIAAKIISFTESLFSRVMAKLGISIGANKSAHKTTLLPAGSTSSIDEPTQNVFESMRPPGREASARDTIDITTSLFQKIQNSRVKSGSSVTGLLYVKIAQGKAKVVLQQGSDEQSVYYTPVRTLLNSKEREIKGEVRTAQTIQANLFMSNLTRLLVAGDAFSQKETKATVDLLLSKCSSKEDFIAQLEDKGSLEEIFHRDFGISAEDSSKLAKIFENPENLEKLKQSGSHLAVDLEEVQGDQRIEGQYTIKTSRASGDLEKDLTNKGLSLLDRMELGLEFLSGTRDLHQAGFVHGDLKPENVLVYKDSDGKKHVKVADFGKTKKIRENENVMYTGNPRFAPPEGRLSKQGEVYSATLVLIRMLEEAVLDADNDMVTKPNNAKGNKAAEGRRGIEKFLIESEDCPQREVGIVGRIKVLGKSVANFISKSYDDKAEKAVHSYITELMKKLQEQTKPPANSAAMTELEQLLKDMTQKKTSMRPNLETVVATLTPIPGKLFS